MLQKAGSKFVCYYVFGTGKIHIDIENHIIIKSRVNQPGLGPRGGLWPVLLMCNSQGRPVPQQWGH
jgi:hypothetical protein